MAFGVFRELIKLTPFHSTRTSSLKNMPGYTCLASSQNNARQFPKIRNRLIVPVSDISKCYQQLSLADEWTTN